MQPLMALAHESYANFWARTGVKPTHIRMRYSTSIAIGREMDIEGLGREVDLGDVSLAQLKGCWILWDQNMPPNDFRWEYHPTFETEDKRETEQA